jgi:hypothetical protein
MQNARQKNERKKKQMKKERKRTAISSFLTSLKEKTKAEGKKRKNNKSM